MSVAKRQARERGRLWAESEAAAMIGPAAGWPEAWGPPYALAVPHVRNLTDDPFEVHRLAALAWFAAAKRWRELLRGALRDDAGA